MLKKLTTRQKNNYIAYLEGNDHRKILNRLVPFIKGEYILDLGCGSGTLLEIILKTRKSIKKVVSIEISDFLYQRALKKKISKTAIYKDNILTYNFPINAFDTVILSSVVHEIISRYPLEKFGELLAKIYKTLKKDGLLLISDGFSNDRILVNLKILNPKKEELFSEFRNRRKEWSFLKTQDGWITTLTAAFDFIHKCYYVENWLNELDEYYYPISLETYKVSLYSAGFKKLKIITYPELENYRQIKKDFSLGDLNGKNLLNSKCNCLIVAYK